MAYHFKLSFSTFYLNICPFDYYGFCNQIYSICGTCSYAVDNNIRFIFIGKYRKQIKTENYCNISDIIDLKLTNLSDKTELQKSFTRSSDYDVRSIHSDTINNENNVIKNIIQQLTDDITNFIILSVRLK